MPGGKLRVGWLSFGNTYYYCSSDASIVQGCDYPVNGILYTFDENGVRQIKAGWGEYNGNKYYINPSTGFPYTGWVTFGRTWYYADKNGIMVSGWQSIGGYQYYFDPQTKIMARNTFIDGIRIGDDGKKITARVTLDNIKDSNNIGFWNTDYVISTSRYSALNNAISAFHNRGWSVGFVMVDIKTGQAVTYNPCGELYSASAIKGPYVLSLLDAGYAPDGTMWNTINWSSNTDYEWLRQYYGADVFKKWIAKTGAPTSRGNSWYTSITPLDLSKMWLYSYDYFNGNRAYSDWARSTYQYVSISPISATLNTSYTVYSKAGWIAEGGYYNVYNDAGIVTDGKNPYVIAVMSSCSGTAGNSQMQNLISQLNAVHTEMVR